MASTAVKLEQLEDRRDDQLGYAGDIDPQEAWDLLATNANAQLIDVRTQPEWVFVGIPDISTLNKRTHGLSWKMWPTMEQNSDFAAQLQAAVTDPDAPVCFICKTGGRSLDAAVEATKLGYSHAFNISHGFEGDKNPDGQRGGVNGWKATGLAWEQQ